MTKRIFGLSCDNGDGSASIHWFETHEAMERALEEDEYNMNEGGPSEVLDFPDDLNLKACGFTFMDDQID